MRKIDKALADYINKINTQLKDEWKDRFYVKVSRSFGSSTKILVELELGDNLTSTEKTEYVEFFKLFDEFRGFKIWDAINKFVLMCLSVNKGEDK